MSGKSGWLVLSLLLWHGISSAGTVTYVYVDHQGTVLAEADAGGNLVAQFDYRPYGRAVDGSSQLPSGPGYTGHVNDRETGLVYMQARYYMTDGQFLSVDPLGVEPGNLFGFSRYSYARGNPVNYIDPDGRQANQAMKGLYFWQQMSELSGRLDNVAEAANKKMEKVDIKIDVAIARGPGVRIQQSLLHGEGSITYLPVAFGQNVSVDLQPRKGFVFDFAKNSSAKSTDYSFGGGPSFEYGEVLHAGLDIDFNPGKGGSFTATPKAGLGYGTFHSYTPEVKVLEWNLSESSDNRPQGSL
ncbi:RHS repeat-associated core domain-containing protein [Dyella sp. BiH032]|uniref:RHS repeat-associated core domain-containing protein n=1 Tax=Dyella sp. BiH032 TaxID=3075430 RepID=UPI00289376CE|nr:RHS repeat-associated core domain-containing protein [Dyella sp. BiH032]WNL47041.1 RHS repeat-associated core domain-containing protein [Dyella sp. BiH032]